MIVGHYFSDSCVLENNAVFGIRNIFKCSEVSEKGENAIRVKKFDIPSDIFQHIFSFLSFKDLCRCSQVCKFWTGISDRPSLWRALYFREKNIWPLPQADKTIKEAYRTRTLTGKYSLSSPLVVTSLVYEGEHLMIAGSINDGSQAIEVYQPRAEQKACVLTSHTAPITSMVLVDDKLLAVSNSEAIWYTVSGVDLQEMGNTNKLEDYATCRFVTAHMNQKYSLALFAGDAVTYVALYQDSFTKIDRECLLPIRQPLCTLKGSKLYYVQGSTPRSKYNISCLDLITGQNSTLASIPSGSGITTLEVDIRASEEGGWVFCGFENGVVGRTSFPISMTAQFTDGPWMSSKSGGYEPIAPISSFTLAGNCVVASSPDRIIFLDRYDPRRMVCSSFQYVDPQPRSTNRRIFFTQSEQVCIVDEDEITVQDYSFMIEDDAKATVDSEAPPPKKRRTGAPH